ncbi:damage-control phosphatase ARMT1 isoform X1 [Peromyscus leucopus]|uniref:damage-control phosphatase ARMT1 isoform X1 n=2 Tax=Peromyscus leucopus TaxID=10041 RepID=UPI0010A17A4A|nr:damage-control phosphatase ARMT1 isoform X1 [Peromyscus leucopus]XP_028746041.1 damage-control phosphatase ARMT1 isoform X1 [Peromyscus leucopus]
MHSCKMSTELHSQPHSSSRSRSFAYLTIKDRTPQILTKAIDTLHRHKSEFFEKHGEEGVEAEKKAISLLSKLRNELQTDKPIIPLVDKHIDTDIWNQYLEYQRSLLNEGDGEPRWFFSPWLFVECYMYRRIHEAVIQSPPIHDFDVFKESKDKNFFESQESINALCTHLQQLKPAKDLSESQLKDEFFKLLQISLWGNKCDLSLSGGESSSQKTSVIDSLEGLKPFILINDTESLWTLLSKCKKTAKPPVVRVDIVLDNSGFELVTDLVFADFLLSSELATEIHFHGKTIPWFVSDVTVRDFNWTVEHVKSSDQESTSTCGAAWENYVKMGRWIYHDHIFWTLPHPYCAMAQVAPDLYAELQKACLVLFKGDLNYRKLTSDRKWEFTVPFHQALSGFHPAPLCSIRTLKAELQVGLQPGQAEQLSASDPHWLTTGKYGVFQFDGPL